MDLLSPALALVGLVALVAAGIYVGRSKAKDETIEAQQATIGAQSTRIDQMLDGERRCSEKIAQLTGRMDQLEAMQTQAIAAAMAPQVADLTAPMIVSGVVRALQNGEWGGR